MSYFAPVLLFFFFFLVFMVSTLRWNDLHAMNYFFLACFFFQAEHGIRDATVTGVQTCALPISDRVPPHVGDHHFRLGAAVTGRQPIDEIGRASCRERAEITVAAGVIKKKQ